MVNFSKKDNLVETTYAFVNALKVKASYTTIKEKIKNNLDYPSFLSVSEVLDSLRIDNVAAEVAIEELAEVPTPCIATLTTEGRIFVVISEVKDDFVEWLHTEKGKQRESIASFSEKWEGILLLAQTTEASGEANYAKNRRKEILTSVGQILLVMSGFAVFAAIIYNSIAAAFSMLLSAIIAVKFVGILVSLLLLWYLFDKQNPFLKNICQVGKSANCNAVLNSKLATISGILSWSEIGFFYFAGSFLALLMGLENTTIITILAIINLLALPYTLFSVYYQGIVVKKWCILCLSIQILLWCEFGVFYFNNSFLVPILPNLKELLLLFIAFISPVVAWFILKPIIHSALQTDALKKTLKKFQNNTTVFEHLLSEQPPMYPILPNMETIELGNSDAQNVITLVTNPYCRACAEKHRLIKELLEHNNDNLKCQIVFTTFKAPDDIRSVFVSHLFSLDRTRQIEALDFWFDMEEKDFEKWASRFPINENLETASKTVKMHAFWCTKSNIQATPTIFINGFQLPDVYQIEDIQRIAYRIFAASKSEVA